MSGSMDCSQYIEVELKLNFFFEIMTLSIITYLIAKINKTVSFKNTKYLSVTSIWATGLLTNSSHQLLPTHAVV